MPPWHSQGERGAMTPAKEKAPLAGEAQRANIARIGESDATNLADADQSTGLDSQPPGGRWGAADGDWDHFARVLGLSADLLPVVSNPNAIKSPDSKIAGPGKTPSRYNGRGELVGFLKWTEYQATAADVGRWSKNPDYGICLQTRLVRALDVDVEELEEAIDIEEFIGAHLGFPLPIRRRPNSCKFAMLFTLPGDYTKRRFKTEHGVIEFLATGQQAVIAGTHPSGARYEIDGGLPAVIPTLTAEALEALWTALQECFGSEASVTVNKGTAPARKRLAAETNDATVDFLVNNWTVHGIDRSGRVDILCPFEEEHTTDSGESATSYFPAGVGGFQQGHYKCQHAHCAHRNNGDFIKAIGIVAAEFEVVPPGTLEAEAKQAAIRERNTAKAARQKAAANERTKFTSGRSALEAARREHQKLQNELIGEGEHTIPAAEVITLETTVNRFVFLSDGSRVADVFNPHYDLALSDWAATYAASTEMVPQPDKETNGRKVKMPDKEIPVSKLWTCSPRRKTAVCRTFSAGGALVLNDPNGRPALNSWKPYDRSVDVPDMRAAGVHLFLDHVDFLFGQDAARFLNWLAHIEQHPGVLPHTGWLHIAKNFGTGRNCLASVLARVWAGSVAANLNLVRMLKSGFNDRLSRKVLAIVDEIHEGGRETQWEHAETLKGTITEEYRAINPKYGRVSVEFNSCRWLMFSQHMSAIPMEKGDRRIEVVATEAMPKGAEYYARLYTALDDPLFIASVATFLGCRDISAFNPGAHAMLTEAKKAATKASQTPTAEWCELLVDHWPSDLITSSDLFTVLMGVDPSNRGSLNAGHRKTLEQFGIVAMGKAKKVNGNLFRLSILRNKEHWKIADSDAIKAELAKVKCGLDNARDYLEEIASGECPEGSGNPHSPE
jgi:hypothetical protein